ncbi:DUF5916 domain-containing protein [Terrimonas alba]|uniref:DUF5916 domain-containing protein n=1 Tax=Terrimonas alba TaxID=3349636 RepID=UPI0035F27394
MRRSLSYILLLLFNQGLNAQDAFNFPPPAVAPVVHAIEVNETIIVDGKLNEAIWQQAPAIKDFFKTEPRQGGKYLYETSVKIVFDKNNLYFGVFCKDSVGKKGMRVQDMKRDWEYSSNDNFYVSLDPQNTKRFCVSFMTTPLGNVRDVQVFDDSFRDIDWDALWKVRTSVTDSGWYAEMAIPFSSLRYNKTSETDSVSWGITFARLARRDYEKTVFPAIPQAFTPQRMAYAAQLKGLRLPPPATNIRLQPYVLFQSNKNTIAAGTTSSSNQFKNGGEAKWAVNPQSVLDITFNTDFAQADLDRAVNNLTRFNVLFPERRQFFLENSGLYAGADVRGLKPFFSRTIGLANTQFNADPVPIDAGIRFTNRNQKQAFAGLYVHQRATEYQGAANFAVLRYFENYGRQSNIGLMLTHRLDEANASKGFDQRNNTTATIDGFIRPKDDFNIQYLLTASRNNTSDSIGFGGNLWFEYTPNKLYAYWKTTFIDDKYLPGMGFTFTSNTFYNNGCGYYMWRPNKGIAGKLIRRWDPGFFIETYQDGRTYKFQSANLYLFPVYIIFKDNSTLEYAIYPTWEHFFFEPLGFKVEPKKYYYTRQQLRYNSDASKKISGNISYYWGKFYDGKLDELNLGIRLAPDPKIAFTGSYQLNKSRRPGIDEADEDIVLWTIGCRLAANPRIQFSGFYQYNTFDKQGRWNLRGSWEFAPLSFLYVVFNESSFRDSPVRNQSFISKLTYLKQF